MTEFLKGYAAGANDMEAGRLVTDTETIESLREQLESWENAAAENAAAHLAAEAKLAEVEKDYESAEAQLDRTETRLAEVEKERDHWRTEAATWKDQLNEALASMDRARELAEERQTHDRSKRLAEIARILSGDEEPTTKGDA